MFRQIFASFVMAFTIIGCAVHSGSDEALSPKSELSRKFVETVLLGAEYGASGSIARFARSPRISVFGADANRRSMVQSAVGQINQAISRSGIQMSVGAENDRSADMLVYYAPMTDFARIAQENGFQYYSGNSGFFWIFWNGSHEITKSIVCIATDVLSSTQLQSVTLEELTQAMGAVNDQNFVQDSIFFESPNDSGYAMQLGALDRDLLDFLYTKLRPGLSATQVDYVFKRSWTETL